ETFNSSPLSPKARRRGDLSKTHKQFPAEKVVENLFALMGGRKKASAALRAQFEVTSKLWNQNTEIVGRILRCHLFVEHFITEYLVATAPEFDFDEARLTFTQKLALIRRSLPLSTSYLIPGMRHLNVIRNRLSHTLRGEISED